MVKTPNKYSRPTKADLLALARKHFFAGTLDNIQQLADELGISRATAYNWVGNGEQMMPIVLASMTEEMFRQASKTIRGQGAVRVRKILMRLSRDISTMKAYRQLFESNPEKMLRMVTSKNGPIQRKAIEMTEALLNEERARDALCLPFDAHTMAYILTRICESFLYSKFIAGEPSDLASEEIALKALLESGEVKRPSSL